MASVTGKTAGKRRRRTRADYVRIIIFCLVIGGFMCTLVSQQLRLISIRRETQRCEELISLKEKEYEKLSEKAEYSSSSEFYEEKARDEGYVGKNEKVFVIGN